VPQKEILSEFRTGHFSLCSDLLPTHVEEGGRRYRFRLREDILFHDGRRFSARDVRYTFERLLLNPQSPLRSMFAPIRGAKALISGDSRDLEGFRIHSAVEFSIDLDEPMSFFPALLAYHGAGILPEGSGAVGRNWQEGCVGTGPFRVIDFEPGRRLELERNKSYWRKGYPRSEGLIFRFGVPQKEILSEFRTGHFSLCSDLLPTHVEELLRDPKLASGYRESPRLATYFIAFNRHRGPLTDDRLRRRLVRAIDVEAFVSRNLGRLAVPAHGFIPPGLLGHEPSTAARGPGARSRKQDEPGGEIELSTALNPVFLGAHAALASDLSRSAQEKGFLLRTVNRTYAEYFQAAREGMADVVVARWVADFLDAHSFASQLHTEGGLLGKLCGSPSTDRLIERGRVETDRAARASVYRQLEEIISEEALLLPLFHEQLYRFARPEVEGLSVSLWGQAVPYEDLRVNP
jgi:ABC-type oligopeptide transport system substrate-binding subunit